MSGLAPVDGLGSAAIVMGELREQECGNGRSMEVVGLHRQLATRQSPTKCGKASRYTVVGLSRWADTCTCLTYLGWVGKGRNTLAHVGMAVVVALPDAPTLTHPPGRRCSSTSRLASARSSAFVTAAQRPEKSHHLTQLADSVCFVQHTHKPTRCDGRLLLSARSLLSRAAAAPPPLMVLCRTPVKGF